MRIANLRKAIHQENCFGSFRKNRLAVTQAHSDLVDLELLSLIFWLVMAGLSVMAFDSGVTQEAWNFVIAVWAYPIWPLGFAIAAWIAYARKKDGLAGVLTTLTFLPVLGLIIILAASSLLYSISI